MENRPLAYRLIEIKKEDKSKLQEHFIPTLPFTRVHNIKIIFFGLNRLLVRFLLIMYINVLKLLI